MSKCIKIKQGLDIKLAGEASKVIAAVTYAETCAIKPPDFNGLTPKLLVKEGDVVLAGTPVLCDKNNESIRFCSVVSGEVIEIVRGEKRKILEVRILADKETNYIPFETTDPAGLSRQEITDILLASGAWPLIRQRPFATIANPADTPKSIFVPAFDSNPLAPDNDFILQGEDKAFQAGLDALRKLTPGTLHLNIRPGEAVPAVFTNATGVQVNTITGPHPSGNVGVQIHHIDPINKGEVVWYIHPQDVLIIGRLFINGKFDATRLIALTGSQVFEPKYYKAVAGTAVNRILADGRLKEGVNRVISGNILSGTKIPQDGYLGFYDTHLTVIPEGHEAEFMGWLAPGLDKFSMSRTFFSWLTPNKKHQLDTNLHGEERPFVVTGEYEKVFPMDIYPVQLIKSILVEDVELMEQLGIYEVAEEDFALCEVVCTSKIKSQEIIRRGLEIIRKEFT